MTATGWTKRGRTLHALKKIHHRKDKKALIALGVATWPINATSYCGMRGNFYPKRQNLSQQGEYWYYYTTLDIHYCSNCRWSSASPPTREWRIWDDD